MQSGRLNSTPLQLRYIEALFQQFIVPEAAVMFTLTAQSDGDWSILFRFQHPIGEHLPKNWASGSKDCCVDRHLLRRRFRACKRWTSYSKTAQTLFIFLPNSGKLAQTLSIKLSLVMSEQAGIWTNKE
jgi:hypothetical protein